MIAADDRRSPCEEVHEDKYSPRYVVHSGRSLLDPAPLVALPLAFHLVPLAFQGRQAVTGSVLSIHTESYGQDVPNWCGGRGVLLVEVRRLQGLESGYAPLRIPSQELLSEIESSRRQPPKCIVRCQYA